MLCGYMFILLVPKKETHWVKDVFAWHSDFLIGFFPINLSCCSQFLPLINTMVTKERKLFMKSISYHLMVWKLNLNSENRAFNQVGTFPWYIGFLRVLFSSCHHYLHRQRYQQVSKVVTGSLLLLSGGLHLQRCLHV